MQDVRRKSLIFAPEPLAQRQPPIRSQPDARAELPAFTVERLLHPPNVGGGCGDKLKTPDLKHREFETSKGPSQRLELREIHNGEIATKFFVAANALIIIQEVAASVEDQSIFVYFDGFRVVRGMAVDKGNICTIGQSMRKPSVLFWNLISPIRSPMNGGDDHIARPPQARDLFGGPRDAVLAETGEKVHAGGRCSCSPIPEDAARRGGERKYQQASF